MSGNSLVRVVTIPAFLLWVFVVAAICQTREPRFAYCFEGPTYEKVDLRINQTVSQGSLYEAEEIRSLLPQSIKWGSIGSVPKYDANTHRLYFVATQPETYTDERWKDRIIIVQVPDFKLVGKIDLDRFVAQSPNILIAPDGKRLFVSYDLSNFDENNFVFVQEVYDTSSLDILETKQAHVARDKWDPEAGRDIYFSDQARFSEDGRKIYDVVGSGRDLEVPLQGYDLVIMDGQVKRNAAEWPLDIKEFVSKNPGFKLLWSGGDPPSALLAKTQGAKVEPRSMQPVPKPGTLSSLWKRLRGYATGLFVFYDPSNAKPLSNRFSAKELAGFNPTVLAMTPNGTAAYFAKTNERGKRELYRLDLENGGRYRRIKLFNIAPQTCIFSDL